MIDIIRVITSLQLDVSMSISCLSMHAMSKNYLDFARIGEIC